MYKHLIRPVFFKFNAEFAHHFTVSCLRIGFAIPGIKNLVGSFFKIKDPNKTLERTVFGLTFKNPVGIAAGFDKNARVFNHLSAFGFSHVEIGTVTPKGQSGNPKPRLFRMIQDEGIINRMGFNNKGVENAVKNLKKRKTIIVIGGNIGKNTATPNEEALNDYIECFEALFDYVDYFVVNVSCPNVTNLRQLQDQDSLLNMLNRLQTLNNAKPKRKPILLKISPDLNNEQLDEVIEIINISKIDGVVATNTTTTRNTLNKNRIFAEQIGNGGLSGKPLAKRSTEIIRYLAQKSNKAFPIIGVGGIFTAEDAIEKLEAGADLVQVFTGFIYEGPAIAKKINQELLKIQQ
ncbi:MAG: quinone-dependent dihydroorotate dehydrogenase [Lentimicrobiaceae bacterium]|jgi:dihydroorotate dehydrogenase|nr:quinone-dependent dihydroorotate dehydrogenase [Lentimicrobiaceae bacterium]